MFAIPQLSRNEARARSLIANRAIDLSIDGAGGWTLNLEALSRLAEPVEVLNCWHVEVDYSGAQFLLILSDFAGLAWIRHKFPDLDSLSLPDTLLAAVLEAAISEMDLLLQKRRMRGAVRVLGIRRGGNSKLFPHAFSILLSDSNSCQEIRAFLHADSLGLIVLASLLERSKPISNNLEDLNFPVIFRAVFGHASLKAASISSLRLQDVIFLDACRLIDRNEDGFELLLHAGSEVLHLLMRSTSATVLSPLEHIVISSEDVEPVPGKDDELLFDPDELPVQVTFDLGELRITLSQLRQIQVGQTFELGHALAGCVRMRVNGVLFGYGELVEIDGRIGVLVSALKRNVESV